MRRMCTGTARRGATGAALALAILASGSAARAGAFEVFGAGPVAISEAGARAVRATDGTAAFFNPGGLGMGRGVNLQLAPLAAFSTLSLQGETAPVEDAFGFVLAADGTVPFKGFLTERVRAGIALYVPPSSATRLLVTPPEQPQLPYFANRTQRLVVVPAVALKLASWLAVGGGINVLAGVQGPADVRSGASGAPEPRLAIDATTQVALHAGVRVDLSDRVHLGASYRQQFSVPVFVSTKAELGGIELSADVDLRHALFDPHTFTLGAAFDLGRLDVEIDASYSAWSAYDGPVLGVTAELPGARFTSELRRRDLFHDVVTLRAGAGYGVDIGRSSEIVLHAGAGIEPSILGAAPQGLTSFADGDKLFGGLGASLSLRDVLPRTVRLSAGLGATFLLDSALQKRACTALPCPIGTVAGPDPDDPSAGITNPGYPQLTSGGTLWTGSLGVGVEL
ncbi:MAG: hypothetical protein R3B70_43870 [Polyangiaceae bacterium]